MIMDKESQQAEAGRHQQLGSFAVAPEESGGRGVAAVSGMVDYMLGQPPPPAAGQQGGQASSFDKLSFSDVLQFADFGPRLGLNQPGESADVEDEDDDDDDDSYFLRFQSLPSLPGAAAPRGGGVGHHAAPEQDQGSKTGDGGGVSESTTLVQQPAGRTTSEQQKGGGGEQGGKSGGGRRKRPRTIKTSEEVESQRMTHIAVERNRRRQMNEYLRVLRSLMPGSYVQRGDQASIIGGAIEFIRELEQLIQCLESQKRRRLYGASGDAPPMPPPPPPQPPQQGQAAPLYPPSLPFPPSTGSGSDDGGAAKVLELQEAGGGDGGGGLREEVVENKSCVADIEVRVLGADAMIKILSRRRAGQLIKIIAALEDMHMSILHTNITTIEQTVLYSFNVKIAGEARFSAEDIAGAVHQILSFIDANYAL